MRKFIENSRSNDVYSKAQSEKGAALVIVLLVMLLLMGFVAVVLSRVNSETIMTANDAAENRSNDAAEAQVEWHSRDFKTLFERKLSPPTSDIDIIRASTVTGFPDYDFSRKSITQIKASESTLIPDGDYAGLFSLRDEWEIDVTAKDNTTGVESRIKRSFNNDRIPLFQFGMFYEDDLELNRPPLFTFGGRVHTNGSLFITAGSTAANPAGGIYFNSKTTVVGEIVNDIWKMGTAMSAGTDDQNSAFFTDAGGTNRELFTGKASVKCVNPSGANVFALKPNLPNCSARAAWVSTDKLPFQGNLDNGKARLNLPLYRLNVNLVELVKRGKNIGDAVGNGNNPVVPVTAATKDNSVLSFERFANKQGLRISLADAQNKLPGCANVVAPNLCGVQLDGVLGATIGYLPKVMQDGYQATALNATRFAQDGKQMWIKVEIVNFDYDSSLPVTKDITEDILSLGVTEPAPVNATDFQINGYTAITDTRSIIKLQRFTIPGPTITNAAGAANSYLSNRTISGSNPTNHNLVIKYINDPTTNPSIDPLRCGRSPNATNVFSAPAPKAPLAFGIPIGAVLEDIIYAAGDSHLKCARFANAGNYNTAIVPFPIQLFDTREGVANDRAAANAGVPGTDSFGADNVPRAGVMSIIDIDVANLRKFLNGTPGIGNSFNGLFPTTTPFALSKLPAGESLKSSDIPENKGWVVYVSDRRGDADFDGEYDMEDVIPDGAMQFNEDVNGTGILNPGNGIFEQLYYSTDPLLAGNTFFEAPRYADISLKSQAATSDHGYFRRGVRLINGSVLPGVYNRLTPTTTKGFTFASENGVYVKGNYNATGVTLTGTTAPAPAANYQPQGGSLTVAGSVNATNHIPAAIVSDSTTILSNAWNDSKSFATPFAQESRVATATQVRFALLTGDVITGQNSTTTLRPSPIGGLGNGGVHNFKRFLEQWTGVRLNYIGSLVNLFNSRNNNGFFKCCDAVYNPPIRDWTFDTTFVDPNRLPPGTPYLYSMNFTGFQRVRE